MKTFDPRIVLLAVVAQSAIFAAEPETPATSGIEPANVVWDSPSENSMGSMPLGNGDIGANVWVEPNGDLVLLLSKTDAYDEFGRLLKIGRVRIKTDLPLLQPGESFKQTLNLREGCIDIAAGDKTVRVWVDANHPVVQADFKSPTPMKTEAIVEIWRTAVRPLSRRQGKELESHSAYQNFPEMQKVNPDVVLPHDESSIAWCHQNTESIWEQNLKHTALDDEIPKHTDPLLHRTFGAVIRGTGMKPTSDQVLASTQPASASSVQITILTEFADSPADWRKAVNQLADQTPADISARFAAHQDWWRAFWEQSWISITAGIKDDADSSEALLVTRAYAMQRFISACAGRGALPIKFNGTLFTVDEVFDADYRRWGGPYWLQNTRLVYWPMLYSGDYELMKPLFKMVLDQLPLRMAATKKYFGHDGAYYPETAHFWGNFADGNYGFKRGDLPEGITQNTYIRRHWVGIIEIVGMMLDYYHATQDAVFRDEMLMPLATETLRFYDQHWPRGEDGKILYSPSQSLETYFDSVNPTPDIAAIRYLIPELLKLDPPAALRAEWEKQLADQPEIPLATEDGKTRIRPAQQHGKGSNMENPELYAIFPFRLYTLANASATDLQTAINTFHARRFKANFCWQQGPIWAAMLGLTQEAKVSVVKRAGAVAKGYRFPGFYGPNHDWTPDQDHIGVFQIALQRMLLQTEGDRILLLPAWPKEWDVDFKLHAPHQTTVEGEFRDGEIRKLKVTPEARRKDVKICRMK
jgi:alpha-L-fucosidase 2